MDAVFNPDDLFDASEFGFNQARIDDGTMFISGQVAVDSDRHVVGDDIEAQARKAFENLGTVLDTAGKGFNSVGKVTTYVVDLDDNVGGYRDAWTEVFDEPYPCHTLIGVDQLSSFADGELLIEVDAEVSLEE